MKGLPLSQAAPIPYYSLDDMVILDFSITTPANIQPGDGIIVSASEVYTVITGAYGQTEKLKVFYSVLEQPDVGQIFAVVVNLGPLILFKEQIQPLNIGVKLEH